MQLTLIIEEFARERESYHSAISELIRSNNALHEENAKLRKKNAVRGSATSVKNKHETEDLKRNKQGAVSASGTNKGKSKFTRAGVVCVFD